MKKTNKEKFEALLKLNKKHHRGSWAIWSGTTALETADCSILDRLSTDEELFSQLNFNYVIVAMNASGKKGKSAKKYEAWRNFHSKSNKDYRLPKAFEGTEIWGAYMTDFIKESGLSSSMEAAVKNFSNMSDVERRKNIKFFEDEINIIGLKNIKKIIVLGEKTLLLMKLMLPQEYREKMVGVWHYAVRKSDKDFKKNVKNAIFKNF